MAHIPDDGDHENTDNIILANGPHLLPKAGTPPMAARPPTSMAVRTTSSSSSLVTTSDDSPFFLPAS